MNRPIRVVSLILLVSCIDIRIRWISLRWKVIVLQIVPVGLNIVDAITMRVESSEAMSLASCSVRVYSFLVDHFHFLSIFLSLHHVLLRLAILPLLLLLVVSFCVYLVLSLAISWILCIWNRGAGYSTSHASFGLLVKVRILDALTWIPVVFRVSSWSCWVLFSLSILLSRGQGHRREVDASDMILQVLQILLLASAGLVVLDLRTRILGWVLLSHYFALVSSTSWRNILVFA